MIINIFDMLDELEQVTNNILVVDFFVNWKVVLLDAIHSSDAQTMYNDYLHLSSSFN